MSKRNGAPGTVSVIIPTRDRPRSLAHAITSVLRQSHRTFELIVVEDGGGDGAATARAFADPRIVVLDGGQGGEVAARNLAITAAAGESVAFLDDDDWWVDDTLLARMAARLSRRDCLVCCSGAIVIERPDGGCEMRLPFRVTASRRLLLRDNRLLVSGIAYRRSLHDRLGAFDPAIARYWDWDWYLRLAAAGIPFVRLAGDGVRVTAGGASQSGEANAGARRADLDGLARKHGLPPLELRNHLGIALDDWRAERRRRAARPAAAMQLASGGVP